MSDPDRTAWDRYVDSFHLRHPGITETILGACRAEGTTPYEWLAASIDRSDVTVLDLACGSAPLAPLVGLARTVGIDRSEAELRAASSTHPGSMLVRGDASRLPLADRSVDCVACSLALMVLTPLERAADELARVTRPGGTLALLLPASRPVSTLDRVRYARLAVALRCRPVRFPHPAALRDLHRILEARGYRVASDEQLRFSYPVLDEAAADAIVTSFYLPGVPEPRRTVARGIARRWIGTDLGVPLRRVSAVDDR